MPGASWEEIADKAVRLEQRLTYDAPERSAYAFGEEGVYSLVLLRDDDNINGDPYAGVLRRFGATEPNIGTVEVDLYAFSASSPTTKIIDVMYLDPTEQQVMGGTSLALLLAFKQGDLPLSETPVSIGDEVENEFMLALRDALAGEIRRA